MEKLLAAAAIAGFLMAIFGRGPERSPGNLTPVQVISALGAWALVFANASAIALAIRDGSLLLLCSAVATLAIALYLFLRDDVRRLSTRETPAAVQLVVDDLKQLLGGAPRLGMNALEAVVVDGRCPGIGVTVAPQARVIVRIRRDAVGWLERHQQAGGAGPLVVGSFVRFVVLHELAHVLNGDHRTFRFVRSMLVAHLVWIGGAFAAGVSLMLGSASAVPFAVAASIVVLFVAQCLVARRFIAERERLADWRAMQTLAPADAARLLARGGRRRAAANPTELEKLMIDLKAQASAHHGRASRVLALVWPEGEDVHKRAEQAAGDPGGGAPRPVLWAALVGMQCGGLGMSLSLAAITGAAPWIGWRGDFAEAVMLTVMAWTGSIAVTFCEMRVDPALMRLRSARRARMRMVVGIVFYLSFTAAALVFYRFQVRFGVASMLSAFQFTAVLMYAGGIVGCCVWSAGVIGGSDGGGEMLDAPRSAWIAEYPLVAALALVLPPASIGVSQWLGIGAFRSWLWIPLMFTSFMAFVCSTGMARSTKSTLRKLAPMAVLDTPSPVYGFRVFWRDYFLDLSHMTLMRGATIVIVVHAVALTFFVLVVGFVMQRLRLAFTADATFAVVLFAGFCAGASILIIPDRYRAYSGPSAQLLDRGRLEVFEKLLAAARHAHAPSTADLQRALSQWLRNERFPDAVLPDAQAVWPLASLLSLVRLARATGETAVLARWRDRIERALREVVHDDAVAIAAGQPPSLHWAMLAVSIVNEAGLRDAFPFERMLDRVESLLDARLARGTDNFLNDVVGACRLLRRCGRTGPDPQRIRRFARASSLVSRPMLRQSLAELCELAELTSDEELREKLAPIVRSRSWELLQLNPRKDVLLVLDAYLAAVCLGASDLREGASARLVGELASSVAEELVAIVNL